MISEGIGNAYTPSSKLSTSATKMQFGNLLIQSGTVSVTTTTALTDKGAAYIGGANFSFPIAYTSNPTVLTTVNEVPRYWMASAANISTTGARATIGGNANSATKTVYWTAIGYKA